MFYSVLINEAEYFTMFCEDHEEYVDAVRNLQDMHLRGGSKIPMIEYDAKSNSWKFMVVVGDNDFMVKVRPYDPVVQTTIIMKMLKK